eukprot:jgi/Ulvmu1/4775/UM020_0060.1
MPSMAPQPRRGASRAPVLTRVPLQLAPEEFFSLAYIRERIVATSSIVYNAVVSRVVLEINQSQYDDLDDLDDFEKYYPPFTYKLFGFLPLPIPLPDTSKFIQLPEVAARFEDDADFGEQRLAGLNPTMVRGLDSDDPRAAIVAGVPGASAAISAGKMFVLDYTGRPVGDGPPDWVLPDKPIEGGEYEYNGKTYHKALPLPMGFFQWQDSEKQARGQLKVVAIQLHEGGRIYTPADARYDWLMAKIALSIADGNHHEMVAHLGKTHLFTEAFAVATRRNFNDDHALSYLLRAHTRFMIANNRLARDYLIGKGFYVDRLLSGYIEESAELARLAVLNTHFYKDNFKNDIVKRKVGTDRLPYYPYRDDGQRLWDAIWAFSTEYVAACYDSDKELQADDELQWFVRELADPKKGAVNGMKDKVETKEDLVEILTTFIFISGPGHTAGSHLPNAFLYPTLPAFLTIVRNCAQPCCHACCSLSTKPPQNAARPQMQRFVAGHRGGTSSLADGASLSCHRLASCSGWALAQRRSQSSACSTCAHPHMLTHVPH